MVAGSHPLRTPTLGHLSEYALRAAEEAGLDLVDAAARVYTAIHLPLGRALEDQELDEALRVEDAAAAEFAARYPTVARLVERVRTTGHTRDDAFDAGLALILRP